MTKVFSRKYQGASACYLVLSSQSIIRPQERALFSSKLYLGRVGFSGEQMVLGAQSSSLKQTQGERVMRNVEQKSARQSILSIRSPCHRSVQRLSPSDCWKYQMSWLAD